MQSQASLEAQNEARKVSPQPKTRVLRLFVAVFLLKNKERLRAGLVILFHFSSKTYKSIVHCGWELL
jgi:hypothetical protein